MKNWTWWLGGVSTAALAFSASLAAAATADATSTAGASASGTGADLGVVTVNARRVAENAQKVPVTVIAVSGAQIDALSIHSVLDLNKIAPGLQIGACSGSRDNCAIVIHGQSNFSNLSQATASQATAPLGVVRYFAESPIVQTSTFDLANIQVIEGPQGTLFGENATGGVLLFTPRKPTNRFGGYLDVQGGNYSYGQVEGAIGGALIEDKLMVRFAGQYRYRKGYTTAYSSYGAPPIDFDNVNNLSLRVSVTFKPIDRFEDDLIFVHSHSKSNGSSSPIIFADPRFMSSSISARTPAQLQQTNLFLWTTGYTPTPGLTWGQLALQAQQQQTALGPFAINYNFDRHLDTVTYGLVNTTIANILPDDILTFRNIFSLAWTSQTGTDCCDVDGTNLPLVDGSEGLWDPSATRLVDGKKSPRGGWPSRSFTNETQFLGKLFGDRLNWQAGFYYRYYANRAWVPAQGNIVTFATPSGDPASASSGFCASVGVANPCSQLTRFHADSYAVYGQGTFAVTPTVHLTGGVRETWYASQVDNTAAATYFVNFNGQNIAFDIAGRPPLANATIQSIAVPREGLVTYTVSGDWQVTPDILLFAANRSGAIGGGINTTAQPGSTDRTYGPQHVNEIELGLKSQWTFFGVHGRTNVSLYRDAFTDILGSRIIAGTAQTVTANLGDAIIQGVNVDATVDFSEWLQVSGNISYTDAYYTRLATTSNCQQNAWLPLCSGALTTAPVVLDRVAGTGTINGTPVTFAHDIFPNASKWKWAIQPTVRLRPWIGENVSLSANIYGISKYTPSLSAGALIGLTPIVQNSILGPVTDSGIIPGRTLVDFRIDWRNIRGSNFSAAFAMTNVGDKIYNATTAGGFTIAGVQDAIIGEPRMWWFEVKYQFGGG